MSKSCTDNPETDGHDEYVEWRCKICAESNLTREAIAYCKCCDDCFCKSCLQYHARFNKTHKVLGIEEKVDWGTPDLPPDTGIECLDHPGHTVSMYCELHDDVCCPVCISKNHDDRCRPKIKFIPEIAEGIGEVFSSVKTNVDGLLSSYTKFEQDNTDSQKLLEDSEQQCVRAIETFQTVLAKHLENLKDSSLLKLKKIHTDLKKEKQAELQKVVKVEQELQEMKQQIQPTSVLNRPVLFVKLQRCKKKVLKISEIPTTLSGQQNHILEFHPNNTLLHTVQSTDCLGDFRQKNKTPAAKTVSERYQTDGCDQAVSPLPPLPMYEDKLLIKGLNSTTSKEFLFNLLEAQSKGNVPIQEQHGEQDGVRLVTFEKPIEFEKILQSVKTHDGVDLKTERVTVSNCIYVSNYDETLGKDTLELYFEDTVKSGGGQVETVSFNKREGYWLIYFTDYNVVDSVLSREHTLGNRKLTVKLFMTCIGSPYWDGGEPRNTQELEVKCIKQNVAKVEEKAETTKQKEKETYKNLSLLSTKMLLAIQFPSRMEEKLKDLKMNINQNKNEIEFDGTSMDIKVAKLEMFEIVNTFVSKTFSDISVLRLGMFQLKQVKKYIEKRLRDNNMQAVWEVNNDKLSICSTSERNLAMSVDLVKNATEETVISLTTVNRPITSTNEWDSVTIRMHSKWPGRVIISVEDMHKIVICATDDVLKEIVDVINKFLNANSIVEGDVHLSTSITKLLSKQCKQDVDTIARGLVTDHLQITWEENGFKIRGIERDVNHAKTQLQTLASSVKKKDRQIDRPGLGKYISTQLGRESVNSVETYLPCVITIQGQEHDDCSDNYDDDDDGDYSMSFGSQWPVLPSCMKQHAVFKTPDNRNICTAHGDMTEMSVDVLVNTSNRYMYMSEGLGKSVSSKGGQQVKDACSTFKRKYGVLTEGTCFLSPGGDLSVKAVIHVVGPTWVNGELKETDRLKDVVSKVMKMASVQNYKSIAMPAISCGTCGFPAKVAASTIVQGIQNFFLEEQDSPLEFVYLCDIKSETIEAFTNCLTTLFGRVNLSLANKLSKTSSPPSQPKPRKGRMQGGWRKPWKRRDEKGAVRSKSDAVTFTLYAMSKDVIDRAIGMLERVIDKAVMTKE